MSDFDRGFWESVGAVNPYWGVLTHEKYLGRELSSDLLEEFFAAGKRDIDYVVSYIKGHIDAEFNPARALDFGCGVGRLVAAMSGVAGQVQGVDVSKSMLDIARENLDLFGIGNVTLSQEIPEQEFNWINSYIVFQHIPPRQGIALLERLLARLALDGVISIHVTTFRDQNCLLRGLQESVLGRFDGETYVNYKRGVLHEMSVYEYDLSHVLALMTTAGIDSFMMRHLDHGGLHGMWIFGRRER